MDAEISLLMANQALAAPGRLMHDPFIGTGSMAYTCAHFGSLFIGSDIDGRQIRGKDSSPGIIRSANQYGVTSKIVDLLTMDVTQHPWRIGGLFDAIVTDPPYGVRAGAKRLGRKQNREIVTERLQTFMAARGFCAPTVPCLSLSLTSKILTTGLTNRMSPRQNHTSFPNLSRTSFFFHARCSNLRGGWFSSCPRSRKSTSR